MFSMEEKKKLADAAVRIDAIRDDLDAGRKNQGKILAQLDQQKQIRKEHAQIRKAQNLLWQADAFREFRRKVSWILALALRQVEEASLREADQLLQKPKVLKEIAEGIRARARRDGP